MTRCFANADTASPALLGGAIPWALTLPIISSGPAASCRFPWHCLSIPRRWSARLALFPSICCMHLHPANLRAAPIPWTTVQAFAAGNVYDFDIKFITPLRWKNAGGERQLSLLIVRPVAYRLRKGAHLSYRNPAYLICSDASLSPQQILQAYLWRWEIELNFRDEKTLLGFGQPQVRSDPAVRTTATFFAFVYALLLLALENCHLTHRPLPLPRWQRLRPQRPHPPRTTPQAISLLRDHACAAAS